MIDLKMHDFDNIYIGNKTAQERLRRTLSGALVVILMAVMMIAAVSVSGPRAYAGEEIPDSTVPLSDAVQGGAFEVTNYDFTAVVNKDHSYKVEERITVNIPSALQSIEFSIPSGNFRMTDLNVSGASFTSNLASEASTVTIFGADQLSVGIHTYIIRYNIKEFADRDTSKDIFYFNVLLPEWKQPIANVSVNVSFPADFPWDDLQYYAGQFGVQDQKEWNRIEYTADERSHIVTIYGKMLPENFGISLKAYLPDGYWKGALDGIWAVNTMLMLMGGAAALLLIMWLIGGRDAKFPRTQETRPIAEVSPVEVGYVFNSRLSIRDIVRLILYFGTKGYLKISEYEPKRYRLFRVKDPDEEEKHIRNAYNILFEDVYKGRFLELEDLGERLVRMENALKDDVAAGFTNKDMLAYTPLSRAFRYIGIIITSAGLATANALKYSYQYLPVHYVESLVIGLLAAFLLFVFSSADDVRDSSSSGEGIVIEILSGVFLAALSIYVSMSVARQTGQLFAAVLILILTAYSAFMIVIMRARGKGNSQLVMRFRQLRRFIYHPTPRELLENYLADRNYYYDMLIYALTFGAEESWAISFLTLDVPEPEWYSDDIQGQAFSNLKEKPATIDYAHDLRSFVRTVEGAYAEMRRRRTINN